MPAAVSAAKRARCSAYSTAAVAVLRPDAQALEPRYGAQRGGIVQGIRRQIDDQHLRHFTAHFLALGRIVVDEHQRIGADVQLPRDGPQALRFGMPADFEGREVPLSQQHRGVPVDDLQGIGGVVLARHGENDAAAVKVEQHALHGAISCAGVFAAEPDVRRAILAHHAAPQRVVEIHDHRLAHAAGEGQQHAQNLQRHRPQLLRGERHAGGEPLALIEEHGASDPCAERIETEQEDPRGRGGEGPQLVIESADRSRLAGG